MNNISEKWYKLKRKQIEDKIELGKTLSDKRKQYESPMEKYVLSIIPVAFKEDSRYWAFTIGKVYKKNKNKTGSLICTIHRNSEKFPFAFFENQEDEQRAVDRLNELEKEKRDIAKSDPRIAKQDQALIVDQQLELIKEQ